MKDQRMAEAPTYEVGIPCCDAVGPKRYHCTRVAGHAGEHRAWGSKSEPPCEVWPQEPAVPELEERVARLERLVESLQSQIYDLRHGEDGLP